MVLGVGVQSLESGFMLQIQTPTTNSPNHLTPNSPKPTPNSKLLKNQLPSPTEPTPTETPKTHSPSSGATSLSLLRVCQARAKLQHRRLAGAAGLTTCAAVTLEKDLEPVSGLTTCGEATKGVVVTELAEVHFPVEKANDLHIVP